ncbi:hypothetical protein [Burkholderia pseudomultivorans]|uniref:hypothetical protein n=1 Tax=Burkholderia pseudomultivorans TaxID=1207504 RepID=UPI00158E9446|nr:hypothetical protein [Burkholderia pseudomultivorans]
MIVTPAPRARIGIRNARRARGEPPRSPIGTRIAAHVGAPGCTQYRTPHKLSFFFLRSFIRNRIRDVHISGPYCSARADEVTPHSRPGARAGCPTTQQRRSHVSRAHRARGFPFSGNATQRIATWTANR